MKKIYFILFIGISLTAYGQDTLDYQNLRTDEIEGFKLYPNPAVSDVVYITTAKNDMKQIKVYDVFGELILKDRITDKALNISKLSPGVYMVQVTENKKTINRKLVLR
ncbi:T9SS type A sorting domain-containing protein [Maribacter sp. 2210JD10-5]|uniref:T9SS type A sorting domain-containing protein n=1 Tax=Maribacter sp. 2210JD10-5 TaxID=3386272 RepID=UPI0039BCDB5C